MKSYIGSAWYWLREHMPRAIWMNMKGGRYRRRSREGGKFGEMRPTAQLMLYGLGPIPRCHLILGRSRQVDVMEAIFTRRSIRKYTSEPVTDHELEQLLRAAMHAPSAGNERPWEFIVIRDRETLNEITGIHKYAQMLKQAQVAVVVCGDLERQKYEGFWVQDCSAATQNILLAATALGLGAVWLGVHPVVERVEDLRKLLNIPKHVVPLSIVSLGRPAEERETPDRCDESRIHMEKW